MWIILLVQVDNFLLIQITVLIGNCNVFFNSFDKKEYCVDNSLYRSIGMNLMLPLRSVPVYLTHYIWHVDTTLTTPQLFECKLSHLHGMDVLDIFPCKCHSACILTICIEWKEFYRAQYLKTNLNTIHRGKVSSAQYILLHNIPWPCPALLLDFRADQWCQIFLWKWMYVWDDRKMSTNMSLCNSVCDLPPSSQILFPRQVDTGLHWKWARIPLLHSNKFMSIY